MAFSGNRSNSDLHRRKLSFLGFGTDGNGGPDEVQLDAEMEKVFAGAPSHRERPERFDVSQLTGGDNDTKERVNDSDGDSYRNPPYPHAVRKTILSSMKRKDSKESSANSRTQSFESNSSAASTTTATPITSPQKSLSIREESHEEAMLSERAGHSEPHSDSDSEERRVQFNKEKLKIEATGENIIEEMEAADDGQDEREKKKHKGRHQHFKRRKSSIQDHHHHHHRRQSELSPDGMNNAASVINASSAIDSKNRRISVQPEDAVLKESHIDDLISHRSDDPRALRRYRIQPQASEKLLRRDTQQVLSPKKQYDHSPHEVFVQLDELQGNLDEWKETARWIKYEEDVEEGADRWGRPHVAPLSFHSLLNLRLFLEQGVVLLDLEERDFPGVAYKVIEMMGERDLIHHDDKPKLLRALLLRHRHVNENAHGGFPFGSRRKFSSYTSLQNLSSDTKPKIVPASEINGHAGSHSTGDTRIDMREETYSSSQEDLKRLQNDTILKRIPTGAEATTVLVGSVEFLPSPVGAFVRLAEAIQIPGITEVPIPVRFIFILMGPKLIDMDYHEVGRSIATLMSNDSFHNIAYKAEDRGELLSAINEFLDDSIVLPPGNWQRDDLLPFEELKAKSEWIRSRKAKALQLKNKEKGKTADDEKKLLASQEEPSDASGGGGRKKRNPLERTNRLWGGLINDIKRRYPMYVSDFKDGLNPETLAATIFMYFAALSTAITFGGLCSEKTKNLIGIPETLLAASVVGVIFHSFAGQPLTIIGTTGPLVLIDEALYRFCETNNLPFLTVRLYVGIWLAVIALFVSAVEGSVYVRLFTRFTQEIFSALITLIYIFETGMKLVSVYQRHPLLSDYFYEDMPGVDSIYANIMNSNTNSTQIFNTTNALSIAQHQPLNTSLQNGDESTVFHMLISHDKTGKINQPNTALFCTFLTLGTFTIAYFLRVFRNSHFLGRTARRALGDFGVPISIAIFVSVDYFVPAVYTEKLKVPEGLSPSDTTQRGWLIPMNNVPIWLPFAAGVPAILVYILVFMETHISELIVDKPERGLKKGSGLHLDIVLLCFLNTFCGFFGMPWHCAATVRSVTHVSAVTIMSRTHAPGDKPHITDVKEQRVSGLCISMLVGLSVTAAPLLRLIPMSVLFGVFLYMGVASMTGVQLFERLSLFFMPVKYHPQEPYVRRVPTWKMHIFTMSQIIALVVLWSVKSSQFSLAFPFVLIMMVPLRIRMASFFTKREINALDGSQPNVDPNDEPDFYQQSMIPA